MFAPNRLTDACDGIVLHIASPSAIKPGAAFAGGFRNIHNLGRLVRIHQYHDAHTVHKALVKLQPLEEKAFLAEYHAQVSSNPPKTASFTDRKQPKTALA